jgi:hypothetical protein
LPHSIPAKYGGKLPDFGEEFEKEQWNNDDNDDDRQGEVVQ